MNLLDARRLLMATAYETQKPLPNEYQQVDFVESTGTQYIDVGIIPNVTSKFIATFQFTDLNAARQFNGTYSGTGRLGFGRQSDHAQAGSLIIATIGNKLTNCFTNTDMLKHTITVLGNGYRSVDSTFALSSGITFTKQEATFTLFAARNNNDNTQILYYSYMRLFDFRMYDDDVLIRDLIPCYRKSDGKIGLYDTVENKFYTNEGTGEFLKGEDV